MSGSADAPRKFVDVLKSLQLDILIGGSMGLSCVYKNANFIPNDLDIYVKNIDKNKIGLIENAINKTFAFASKCNISAIGQCKKLNKMRVFLNKPKLITSKYGEVCKNTNEFYTVGIKCL